MENTFTPDAESRKKKNTVCKISIELFVYSSIPEHMTLDTKSILIKRWEYMIDNNELIKKPLEGCVLDPIQGKSTLITTTHNCYWTAALDSGQMGL